MSVQDYSRLSDGYDAARYDREHHRWQEELRSEVMLDLLELKAHMRVLDVACGTGRGALLFAPYVSTVLGIDGTPSMLELARRKAAERKLANVAFAVGDAFDLNCRDNEFDRVVSLNFLHLFLPVARQAELIREMVRVLKPGGKLLIELDNALHGGVLGPWRKYRVRDIGYNWPWDIAGMIRGSGAEVERLIGTNLPGMWRLYRLLPSLPLRLERRLRKSPVRYFMSRLQVLCRKT